jgi:DNA ligase-1
MNYPLLYSKSETGAIQVWWMEVANHNDSDGVYRSHSGQLNGKITTSEWTEVYGKNIGKKNATTGYKQAIKEIEAKYEKKLKKNYFKSIEEVDKKNFIQPMLAKNFKDYKDKITYPVFVQCKLNGFRCIATKDGCFTRTGEKYLTIPHIENALKPLFDANPDLVLDGELFNYKYRQKLNEISKLVRKTVNITPEDIAESREIVEYHIYDIIGTEKSYEDREEAIHYLVDFLGSPHIKDVPSMECRDEWALNAYYNELVEDGHEGAIIRLNAPYEQKRSKNLLKLKPDDDAEFWLIDIQEGKGDWSGKAKRVVLQDDKGKTFDGSFKGNMEEATYFLKNKEKFLNKLWTIKYNGLTGLGNPNNAQFDFNNQKVSLYE